MGLMPGGGFGLRIRDSSSLNEATLVKLLIGN